jgi:hypothetical protein
VLVMNVNFSHVSALILKTRRYLVLNPFVACQ